MNIDLRILDDRYHSDWGLPDYAKPGDAGIDLRAANYGKFGIAEKDGLLGVVLDPGRCELIGTGLAIHIADPGYVGLIVPRSGLGHRHGLILGNGTGVIDSSYQGELKVSLWNRSDTPYTVEHGERVAQLLIMPVVQAQFRVVESFEASERGDGGFGSTGAA